MPLVVSMFNGWEKIVLGHDFFELRKAIVAYLPQLSSCVFFCSSHFSAKFSPGFESRLKLRATDLRYCLAWLLLDSLVHRSFLLYVYRLDVGALRVRWFAAGWDPAENKWIVWASDRLRLLLFCRFMGKIIFLSLLVLFLILSHKLRLHAVYQSLWNVLGSWLALIVNWVCRSTIKAFWHKWFP